MRLPRFRCLARGSWRLSYSIGLVLTAGLFAQGDATHQLCGKPIDAKWWTKPEREGWTATSSSRDVRILLGKLHEAFPDAFKLSSLGTSLRGRPIQIASVVRPPGDEKGRRLRAVIIANIHGGEVEGKEALQVILREIAMGEHKEILDKCDVWFVPIYNVDGNDEIQAGNRGSQNGPDSVGMRRNSQNLDLNRDFVKIESPEARALLGLFRRVDPHLFMDLHTTNGSDHGYHLTYAPSLSTNVDSKLDEFVHGDFLPKIRKSMLEKHGFRIYDYGNFGRGRGEPRAWTTYAHQPRYAINYFGLRNRLSLLSEAYSYLPFKQRAQVTRAFVLESLRELVGRREEVLAICDAADERAMGGQVRFGYASRLRRAVRGKILVGSVSREGSRLVAGSEFREVEVDLRIRFEAEKSISLPMAWAVVGKSDEVRKALLMHDIEVRQLTAPIEVEAESFEIESGDRPRMQYEGHSMVTLRGKLVPGKRRLPAGTLIVSARQRTARVAAQLLEGHSEDSLATWNFFDANLTPGGSGKGVYPVLRISKLPGWKTAELVLSNDDQSVRAPYTATSEEPGADKLAISMVCTRPGRKRGRGGYESAVRWEGREVLYGIGPQKFTDLKSVLDAVAALVKNPSYADSSYVLRPDNAITNAELLQLAELLNKAGVKKVYLEYKPE